MIQDDRQKQINDIVSVVKLSALLLLGIILSKKIFFVDNISFYRKKVYYSGLYLFVPLMIVSLIYLLWAFSNKNEFKTKHKSLVNIAEIMVFISIFSIVIITCGINEGQYKFLYLFIIITTTIQFGMRRGITVAIISSLIVLSIDLIMTPGVEVNNYFQDDLILTGIFILTAWPLGFYVKIEGEHIKKLEERANIDGLTELYNHRFFYDSLVEKLKIGERDKTPVSMIFIDIDYFKLYNDTYGHQKGDYVLKKIGSIIKQSVRPQDIAARYGGEEFSVILPNTSMEEALEIAEKMREKIEYTYFDGEEAQPNGRLTASMGVSTYPDKAKNDFDLIKSADDALYKAKFFSKNKVEVYASILDEITKNIDEKDIELVASVKTLISVINAKDKYTYGHTERVVAYSKLLADKLMLSSEDKKILTYGAYMHDIGKINISKEILIKKMKLTDEEWNILKQHPQNGVEIIKSVKSLQMIIPLILNHHERYDGKGYPHNLKGKDIPYLARVLTVVDSFDAMTSNRPYNNRKTYEEGIEELKRCSGTQFDPEIVDAFCNVIKNNSNFISL